MSLLDMEQFAKLSERLSERGSPPFEKLRRGLIWNARARDQRAPDMILQPRSPEEVSDALKLARKHGVKVALRGSGHNYDGSAWREHGLLVDLGALDHIEIDASTQRAWVGAGVRGGDLIRHLARSGLAFPIGHCEDVAISGYLLSGGIGWNYGEWGVACGLVSAAEVVTADGEILRADSEHHPDLLWAVKGAGRSFFAAVTAYQLELQKLPPSAVALEVVFDASEAPYVAKWLDHAGAVADRTVELICLVGPDPVNGKPSLTVRAVASGRSKQAVVDKLGLLRHVPATSGILSAPTLHSLHFKDLYRLSTLPSGKRVVADHVWSDGTIGELLLAVSHLAKGPSPSSAISLTALGGGASISCPPDCAFSVSGRTSAGIYALWDNGSDDQEHFRWVAEANASLKPYLVGRYIGEASLERHNSIAECFTAPALSRLRKMRLDYDPGELFFCNA